MIRAVFFVAMGGAAGSALRYLTSVFAGKYFQANFPVATFLANFLGCFLIGILMAYFTKDQETNNGLRWLLVTGFCGGYTTFSAFAYENISLIQQENYAMAFGYTALSVIAGLAAVWIGLLLGR